MQEDAEQIVDRLTQDPTQQEEWLRENNLIYGGLIGGALVLIQPFVATPPVGPAATISVVAFSVAIPILAALLMLNAQEAFRRRATTSLFVDAGKAIGQLCAFVGVVAAFWHILPIAGVAILASAVFGLAVHSAGFSHLELGGVGGGGGPSSSAGQPGEGGERHG